MSAVTMARKIAIIVRFENSGTVGEGVLEEPETTAVIESAMS